MTTLIEDLRETAQRVLNDSRRENLVRVLRGYVRYMPTSVGKGLLWKSLIAPHLSWLSHEFEATTRFGGRMRGNTEDFIQRHVYYFGLWEPDLTRFLDERLKPGDVFVDVGANIGYFSLQASKLVGAEGRVVSIEASPTIFGRLQGNVALNDATNIRAVNVAAADRPGVLRLYRGPADNQGGTTLVQETTPGALFECEVKAEPLGAIVTSEEWSRARIVKIDVEGAEAIVAEGLVPLLASARPELEIVMEIAPVTLQKQGRSADEVLAMFRTAGYHCYRLENEYSASGYVSPSPPTRPARVTRPLTAQTDVVFSRKDRAVL